MIISEEINCEKKSFIVDHKMSSQQLHQQYYQYYKGIYGHFRSMERGESKRLKQNVIRAYHPQFDHQCGHCIKFRHSLDNNHEQRPIFNFESKVPALVLKLK